MKDRFYYTYKKRNNKHRSKIWKRVLYEATWSAKDGGENMPNRSAMRIWQKWKEMIRPKAIESFRRWREQQNI